MQVALHEVKDKLSEYVSLVQKGTVVEICKYGKPVAFIVDRPEEAEERIVAKNLFMKRYEDFRKRWQKEEVWTNDDVDKFVETIEKRRQRGRSR